MANPLQSINLVAPAFKGINTEDSPLAQDPSFAEVANNAVIDKRGRIAARKGHVVKTTDKTELGSGTIRVIHEFEKSGGTTEILSAGNNKIFTGTTTLTDATPASYTITADNWKIVNFNEKAYLFQAAHAPLVYDGTSVVTLSSVTGAAGIINSNEVCAAYGRLWVVGTGSNASVVYWSDLLIGHDFSNGTSGSIDLSKVWPDGYDEVVALAAHNGLLVIFGKHSIVTYKGAEAPATMELADTISGVGCVDRDTVQSTGTDVLFLSHSGLKSIGRTIQEKSSPLNDLSTNVTKDLVANLNAENTFFRSGYSPEEGFYLLTFVGQDTTYCFDARGQLENGAYRVTLWPVTGFSSYARQQDGTFLIGTKEGISEYDGYLDNGETYRFTYVSPSLTFGDAARIKILKKLKPTIVGANNSTVTLKWDYDFKGQFTSAQFTVGNQITAYFGISEYNTDAEFTGGALTNQRVINATGNGTSIVVSVETEINGSQLSLQEINVMAMLGKLL